VAVSCDYSNKTSGPMKDGEYLKPLTALASQEKFCSVQ
jgi:hypothetical protein